MKPYAAAMHESNRGAEDEGAAPTPTVDPSIAAVTAAAPGDAPIPAGPPIMPALWTWFTIIVALGLVGVFWGQAELALMITVAGAFVAAHAADRDPSFNALHTVLSGVIVAGAAAIFASLAVWVATQPSVGPARPLAVGIAGGGALLCLLSTRRTISDALAAALFRTAEPSHVLRLGARLVMMVMLFAVPGWAAFPGMLETLADTGGPLLDAGQLVGSMIGLSLLALGAVGFLIRRDPRATLDRLGLRVLRPSHYAVVVLGVVALYLLNVGAEALQHRWFPDLWSHDQRIGLLIAGGLGLAGSLLLGVSAGVGEELAMRGALQPRLGLWLTSLVFAALHVQYSWFGMATILVLGMVLCLIRERTSTTVAILVHTFYDVLAVFTLDGASR